VFATPTDLEREDTVWIGELLPMSGPEKEGFFPELGAVDLARRDFAAALGGCFARDGGLHARPIAIVACDDVSDPLRAARHLADDVEVPAVIGFRYSKTVREIVPSVLLPRHVLSFISIAQTAGLNKIPEPKDEPRLVWRSTLDSDASILPLAELVAQVLEPRVRAEGFGTRELKIALVRPNGGQSDAAEEILRDLRFNGKTALENGDNLRHYVYDPESTDGIDVAVHSLVDLAPQIVIVWGGFSASTVIARLESRWDHGARPIYATPSSFGADTVALLGAGVTRHQRLFGMTNSSLTMTNAQLVVHYNQAYPSGPITRTEAPQPSYDAFFMLAYATQAIGDGAVTGPELSTTFARLLPPGTPIDVGPGGIFDAFQTLRSGGNIDLNGALGSLDFDRTTGEAPVDYAIVCPGVSDRGTAQGEVESGLVYESGRKRFVGKLHCP
jgi:branched-chain amino acid transport system substrate-binding protein